MLRGALVLLYFSGGVGLLADSPQDTTGGSGSIKSLGWVDACPGGAQGCSGINSAAHHETLRSRDGAVLGRPLQLHSAYCAPQRGSLLCTCGGRDHNWWVHGSFCAGCCAEKPTPS